MKVLLATDCSNQSTEAAKFLRNLNFNQPISLTVITALGDPYGASPDSTLHWFPELLEEERKRAERHHDDLASLLKNRCLEINTKCRPGHPVQVILAEAEATNCDLIVIGARGHSLLGRLLIGSVSDSVATHAKCSVLVVRPDSATESETAVKQDASDRPTRILLGFDSSNASREAVQEMVELDWHPDTTVELISVAPIYDYLLGNGLSTAAIQNEEEIFNEMKKSSEQVTVRLEESLPNTRAIVVHDQRVGDAIVDVAKKNDTDVVVVGDSGHSLLDDFLLGSTCKNVLRHAECSVWVSRHHRTDNRNDASESAGSSSEVPGIKN